MSILLCAATPFEIQPTLSLIGSMGGEVDVLITGVGLMSTAYSLTKAIHCKRPAVLVQAGIGGYLDPQLKGGQVVAIHKEWMGDLGVQEGGQFRSVFDLNLADGDTNPYTEGALVNNTAALVGTGLPLADGVSVNEISTNTERAAYYRNTLGAGVESMEGAALHFIGNTEAIPYLQIRALSNRVGERDKSKWLMKEAIANLNTELQRILKNLNNV